ncbi:MAG TPA: NUDIX domain-containing protein [Candidatus Polarisedimenticolia bacterium]|nr:NUDIX domain-containing protein [Candidatus Polarisedimenticolia bacterium]
MAGVRKVRSAGLLLYRKREGIDEVFLVHPGGPYWAKRDLGAWSIPKGMFEPGEEALDAARREFREETGFDPPAGPFEPLGSILQPSGKIVEVWSTPGDVDPDGLRSQSITVEWPPRSGRRNEYPEVDRGAWFTLAEARRRILPGQRGFLTALERRLDGG